MTNTDLAKYAFWGGAAYILYYFFAKAKPSMNPLNQPIAQPILETQSLNGLSASATDMSSNPVPVTTYPNAPPGYVMQFDSGYYDSGPATSRGPQLPEMPLRAISKPSYAPVPGIKMPVQAQKNFAERSRQGTDTRSILQRFATSDEQRRADEMTGQDLVGPHSAFDPSLHVIRDIPVYKESGGKFDIRGKSIRGLQNPEPTNVIIARANAAIAPKTR